MQAHLTDLDALALTVRDPRSQTYMREAIAAYRNGAYRAAITSVWVAVSFDIVIKIRELAQLDDGAAIAFLADFDRAREGGHVDRLLRVERELIERARDPFGFLGVQDAAHLRRIKDDRNLCAHPAFSEEAELYQPTPDLVRAHIVHAVQMLLSHPPVQGRAAIAAFVADLGSMAFPARREAAVAYIRSRYLERMRPNARINLAIVALKGLLKDRAGFEGREEALYHALEAVSLHDPDAWAAQLRGHAARLIDEAPDPMIANAFRLLSAFPDIEPVVGRAARLRLRAVLQNWVPGAEDQDAIFAAASLNEYRDAALEALRRAPDEIRGRILSEHPSRAYFDVALDHLDAARGFRGAEARFRAAITPLADQLTLADMERILAVVRGNGQIWDAGDIPALLAAVAAIVVPRTETIVAPWQTLRAFIAERGITQRYQVLWDTLEGVGVITTDLG